MSFGSIILITLGGAFAVEGFFWAIAPDMMRQAYADIIRMLTKERLAMMGVGSLAIGLMMIVLGVRAAGA